MAASAYVPGTVLCRTCGQADNCGDCTHYDFLDEPSEREWLTALDPQDVVSNAHRWYEWVAQFGGDLGDSLIRELAFTKASEALGLDYEVLYESWLNKTPLEV